MDCSLRIATLVVRDRQRRIEEQIVEEQAAFSGEMTPAIREVGGLSGDRESIETVWRDHVRPTIPASLQQRAQAAPVRSIEDVEPNVVGERVGESLKIVPGM